MEDIYDCLFDDKEVLWTIYNNKDLVLSSLEPTEHLWNILISDKFVSGMSSTKEQKLAIQAELIKGVVERGAKLEGLLSMSINLEHILYQEDLLYSLFPTQDILKIICREVDHRMQENYTQERAAQKQLLKDAYEKNIDINKIIYFHDLRIEANVLYSHKEMFIKWLNADYFLTFALVQGAVNDLNRLELINMAYDKGADINNIPSSWICGEGWDTMEANLGAEVIKALFEKGLVFKKLDVCYNGITRETNIRDCIWKFGGRNMESERSQKIQKLFSDYFNNYHHKNEDHTLCISEECVLL